MRHCAQKWCLDLAQPAGGGWVQFSTVNTAAERISITISVQETFLKCAAGEPDGVSNMSAFDGELRAAIDISFGDDVSSFLGSIQHGGGEVCLT